MNIHEFQAKQLLKDYGLPILDGRAVFRAEDAKTASGELDGPMTKRKIPNMTVYVSQGTTYETVKKVYIEALTEAQGNASLPGMKMP